MDSLYRDYVVKHYQTGKKKTLILRPKVVVNGSPRSILEEFVYLTDWSGDVAKDGPTK